MIKTQISHPQYWKITDNEKDLIEVFNAISIEGNESARAAVIESLLILKTKIKNAKKLKNAEYISELKILMNKFSSLRGQALQAGANSYSDPQWAPASACESWVFELLTGDTESITSVERLIDEFVNEKKHPELIDDEKNSEANIVSDEDKDRESTPWFMLLFLFIGLPIVIIYGGIWIGLLVYIIGAIIIGLRKRYED